MRWLLAGLLFALVVGLAVATAAVKAGNVRQRRLLDELAFEREAWIAVYLGERARHGDGADVRQLEEYWRALIERRMQ